MGRSLELTPSTILSACPGDEIVVKCNESETTANAKISLRWEITLMNKTISVIELALSDLMNHSQRQEAGLRFYSEFTSYTPLIAMFWTTAHPVLNGATVICKSAVSMEPMETLTIRILETGN